MTFWGSRSTGLHELIMFYEPAQRAVLKSVGSAKTLGRRAKHSLWFRQIVSTICVPHSQSPISTRLPAAMRRVAQMDNTSWDTWLCLVLMQSISCNQFPLSLRKVLLIRSRYRPTVRNTSYIDSGLVSFSGTSSYAVPLNSVNLYASPCAPPN
jgi:hypothetical protein